MEIIPSRGTWGLALPRGQSAHALAPLAALSGTVKLAGRDNFAVLIPAALLLTFGTPDDAIPKSVTVVTRDSAVEVAAGGVTIRPNPAVTPTVVITLGCSSVHEQRDWAEAIIRHRSADVIQFEKDALEKEIGFLTLERDRALARAVTAEAQIASDAPRLVRLAECEAALASVSAATRAALYDVRVACGALAGESAAAAGATASAGVDTPKVNASSSSSGIISTGGAVASSASASAADAADINRSARNDAVISLRTAAPFSAAVAASISSSNNSSSSGGSISDAITTGAAATPTPSVTPASPPAAQFEFGGAGALVSSANELAAAAALCASLSRTVASALAAHSAAIDSQSARLRDSDGALRAAHAALAATRAELDACALDWSLRDRKWAQSVQVSA